MGYLAAATLAPVLGPVLYKILHPRPQAVGVVDGFVYLAVPLLVGWQVLDHVREESSLLPVMIVLLGFLLPAAAERASHALAEQTDNLALVVGISGLTLHAALEGAAFAPGDGGVETVFALAVILHRIPVGLIIWWLVRPRFGQVAATAGVASVVVATLAGFGVGSELLGGGDPGAAHLYQIFVSGSLVHVVYHLGRHDHDHRKRQDRHHHRHDPEHTRS
ncbi:MAG: hypothetical protein R3304_07905 [Longimicrobiales bacterium]|nr:hypothetical protein [Longimicrobiales bacterium]